MRKLLLVIVCIAISFLSVGQIVITSPADADPSGQVGVSLYRLNDSLCHPGSLNHCINVSGTGSPFFISSFSGNTGNVLILSNTCFQYQTVTGFSGTDSISFTINNSLSQTVSVTVLITVVNQAAPVNVGANVVLYNQYTYTIENAIVNPMVPGSWTEIEEGVVLSDVNSANTTFSNLQPGGNYFIWTQVLPCQTIRDRFIIFVHDSEPRDLPANTSVEQADDLIHDCVGENQAPVSLFSSDCNVSSQVVTTSKPIQYCEVTDASDLGSCFYQFPWSMVFFTGIPSAYRYYQKTDLRLIQHENGEIQLKGTVHLVNRPTALVEVDAWFVNPQSWSEWSTQPTFATYKSDCNGVDANHPDWTYYMMAYGTLTGLGDLVGTSITLNHAPSNFTFGFQLGEGANNVSSGFGFGGWFNFSGQLVDITQSINQSVGGAGDFAVEMECCSGIAYDQNYFLSDDCGNTGTWHDQIEVHDTTPPVLTDTPPTVISCEALDWTGNWQDACSAVTIDVQSTYTTIDQGNDVSTSVITAIDVCGNASTYTYVQEVFDEDCSQLGCTNSTAINFNPDATIDDGSCLIEGCLDSNASNFNPVANIEALCFYNPQIMVFHDLNNDGVAQENEPGLEGFSIQWNNGSVYFYTDSQGMVDNDFPQGEHQFFLVLNNTTWVNTTPLMVTYSSDQPQPVSFGLALSELNEEEEISLYFDFSNTAFCDNASSTGAVVHHNRSTPVFVNAVFEMTGDVVFDSESPFGVAGTAVNNTIQWSNVQINPGEWIYFNVLFPAQGELAQGNQGTYSFQFDFFDEAGSLIQNNVDSEEVTVICNDSQAIMEVEPIGYSTEHFILAGDLVQYKVTFFNATNDVIENVKIEDALESNIYNLTTVQPVFGTDLSLFCLHDDGIIDLFFNDINLAPGASAFAIYAVNVRDDLAPGTLVLNDAQVIYDESATVNTNTVFNTIFDCDSFLEIVAQEELCLGEELAIFMLQPFVESYLWKLNDVIVSNTAEFYYNAFLAGENTISLTVENPLCTKEIFHTVQVHPLPSQDITFDETTNTLIAPDGESWSWFFNGNEIADNVGQTLENPMQGTYSVFVINEWGCSQQSADFVVLGLEEYGRLSPYVFPNPAQSIVQVDLPFKKWEIQVIDSRGNLVFNHYSLGGLTTVPLNQLTSGYYVIQTIGEEELYRFKILKTD